MARSVMARSGCSRSWPGMSTWPSLLRKTGALEGQRAIRGCAAGSVSAMSSTMSTPLRASVIAGAINSANDSLPEPYLSCARARPATVPGTPIDNAESRDFFGSASPLASRNIVSVAAAGARIGYRERESNCNGGVDGIASTFQNFDANTGGALLLRHHHAVAGDRGLRWCDCRRTRHDRDLGGCRRRAD